MDDQSVLQRILDGDEEPTAVPFALLKQITDNFSEERKIGQGGFGEVYKGVYNGEEIAVKLFYPVPTLDNTQFENEFVNLRRIKHPNIIRLVGYCYETQHKYIEYEGDLRFAQHISRILCFEYLQGGSLDRYLNESRDYDWPTCYNIIEGTCEGLNFLHEGYGSQILHLDLKPGNILLDKYMGAKVADFGLSRFFSKTHTHITNTTIGTEDYMPPEFRFKNQISSKNDVYSLGIIIIEIMAGRVGYSKFHEMDDATQFIELVITNWRERINAATSPFPLAELDQVEACVNIAIKCVHPERKNKPTVAEILDTMQESERGFLEEWRNHEGFPLGQSLPTPTKIEPVGGCGGEVVDIKEDPWRLHSVTISYQGLIDAFSFSYIDQSGKKQRAGPWGKEYSYHKTETIRFYPTEFVKEVCGAYGRHGENILVTSLMFVTNIRTYGPFGNPYHLNVAETPFRFMAGEGSSIVGFHGRSGNHLFSIGVYKLYSNNKTAVRTASTPVILEGQRIETHEHGHADKLIVSREDTNMRAEEVPEVKKRKIVESTSGKGKLGSSEDAEATSMDTTSSRRGRCTEQTEAKKRKIVESTSGKGKLGSSQNAETTSMDTTSSEQGQCTEQTDQCILHALQSFSHHYPTNTTYLGEKSRAVDLTSGVMGSLLDKLGKLVTEDYNLEKSMKRGIESFSEDLANIHNDLPNLENLDGVKIWVDEVRELSYYIEDTVDSFLVHVEPNPNSSGFRELTSEGLKLLQNGLVTHHQIGDVIRHIKNQVQVVVHRRKKYNFGVNNIVANATAKAPIDPRIAMYINKKQLIGIEEKREELIRLFEDDDDVSKQELKIVSIVGLGGLGKTTLATAVYDKLKSQYQYRAFVPVGQNPDVKNVLMSILIEFGIKANASDLETEVWQLINKLQEFLEDKRYLLVIDDIWDSEAWGPIQSAFPDNSLGSRVITTTRIHRVALGTCNAESKYVYRMKPLSDEDSRRLFLRRIFGSGKDCPDALKGISADILKRCGGMPLAIISIASLLAGEPASTWDYVTKALGAITEQSGLEKMKQILDLSYMHLPDHLKTCLLYVCMYPEDRQIDKNELLSKWVAEGFVHVSGRNGGLDAEDVAEKYFKEVINMCMIQPEEMDYNNEVVSCRVHDIILDLMRSKSRKENFIHVIDGSKDEIEKIHQVSVQKETRISETIDKGALSHVRSILVYQTSYVDCFLKFQYVRVLHLELGSVCANQIDLTCISRLYLLRYVKVAYFDIRVYKLKLPNQIGELQQLETIDIYGFPLENYPSDIVSLPGLLHLRYGGYLSRHGIGLPDGIGRLKSLRTLVGVCFDASDASSVENIIGLGRLINLRKLRIGLSEDVHVKEHIDMCMNALHSSINMLSANLRILTFGNKFGNLVDVPASWSRTPFPGDSHIRELDMWDLEFKKCPEWIGQLHDLCKLRIMAREVADGVSIVAGLPSLVYFHLYIDMVRKPEEEREERVIIPGGGAFKALKELIFHCKKVSLTFEEGAMPKLEKLEILFRYNMSPQFLPVGIQHLPSPTLKGIGLHMDYNDVKASMYWDDQDWSNYYSSDDYRDGLLRRAFRVYIPNADAGIYLMGSDDYGFDDNYEDFEDVDEEEDYEEEDDEDDDEGVEEEDYYSEEDDEAAYQVNASQTSAQVQANIRQLVQLIEVQKDSGRKSINTDAPPMVDMSLHLAVRLQGWESRRDQASVISEAFQLSFTAPLAPWPSSLHLTPYSSLDRPERMANFPFDINNDLSVEQGNNDSMLVNAVAQDLNLDFPPCGLVDLNEAPNEHFTDTIQMELSTNIANFPFDVSNDLSVEQGNNDGMLVNAVAKSSYHNFPPGGYADPIQTPNQVNDEEFLEVNDLMTVAELFDLMN